MARRKTLEEVKKEFEKYNYTLLENEYVNQSTKMKCICSNGHHIEITYKSVKKYKGGCKKCAYQKLSNLHSHNYEHVRKMFENAGYELLETDYINEQTKMKYRCPKHSSKELFISVNCLKRGQGCPYCSKKKVDYDLIKNILNKKGYLFLGTERSRGQVVILYSCPKHPEEILKISPSDLRKGYGCKYCAVEGRTGENNINWKGGVSTVSSYLRQSAYKWGKRYKNSKCIVTGEKTDIEIHHMKPFHKIRDEVLEKYNLNILSTVSENDKNLLEKIKLEIEEKHKDVKGIPLKKSIHREFHSRYGHDFTEKEFWDFIMECKKGVSV